MRQKSGSPESSSERIVKNIRRATRKRNSPEEKIRIVLDGLRGDTPRRKSAIEVARSLAFVSENIWPPQEK